MRGGRQRALQRLRSSSLAATALAVIALLLLVESFVEWRWIAVAASVGLGFAAVLRIGRPLLLLLSALFVVGNTLALPAVFRQFGPGSASWAWLVVYSLEGLLINGLAIAVFDEFRREAARAGGIACWQDHGLPDVTPPPFLYESSSQSQERFRLMVECIGDYAIVMLQPDGRVASWNVGTERILGYAPEEVLDCDYAQFFLSQDIARGVPRLCLDTAAENGRCEIEMRWSRKDQSLFWAHVGMTPVWSPTGVLLGFATVVRDVSEKRRAEESLRQSRHELEIRVAERTAELAAANRSLKAEVAERIQAQEVLSRQSDVLASILDSISDPIVVAEDLEKPLKFNPAARDLFGVGAGPVSVAEWIRMDRFRASEFAAANPTDSSLNGTLSRALRGEAIDELVLTIRQPGSNRVVWLLASARPLRGPAAATGGAVVVFRDVTEKLRHDQELKAAKEAAESASRAKDQFLAILSHELRTPLTPILLATSDLLEHAEAGTSLYGTLAVIQRNVQLESRLIDDLLDLTRARTGRLTLALSHVDAHQVINLALEVCRSELLESSLRLETSLAAVDHHVEGDSARLQQVFWNLIKNATKFTPPGGTITIRTWNEPAAATAGGGSTFIAEVSDTGIGIEAERLPRIFNAFEERRPEQQRRYGGLGLGLAISRSVIQAHGGRLSASSPGRNLGACFTAELAAQTVAPRGDTGPAADETADGPQHQAQGLRILLVEDNRDTLGYLTGLLSQRGHSVNQAGSYRAASRLARSNDYDLLISDIELPDGTGLDVMREVASRRPTPGIALSGFGAADDVASSLEAGFTEHMTKPIVVQSLDAAIARVMFRSGSAVNLSPTGKPLPPRPLVSTPSGSLAPGAGDVESCCACVSLEAIDGRPATRTATGRPTTLGTSRRRPGLRIRGGAESGDGST